MRIIRFVPGFRFPDGFDLMDDLLGQIARDVAQERFPAVISTNKDVLDVVAAAIDQPGAQIIVESDDAERAAALATALSMIRAPTATERCRRRQERRAAAAA